MPDPRVTVAVNRSHDNCYGLWVFLSMQRARACAFHLSGIYFRLRRGTKQARTKAKSPRAARRPPCLAKWQMPETQQGRGSHSLHGTGHTIMLKHKHQIKGLPLYTSENIHVEMCVAMDTDPSLERWSVPTG